MELLFAQINQPAQPGGAQLALLGLEGVVGIASLVCYIIVLVKMFQNNMVGLGIASLCCGIIALVVGWQRASEWNIKNLMIIWTILLLISVVLNAVTFNMSH